MDPHQTEIFTAVLVAVALIAIILIYFAVSLISHQRRNVRLQRSYLLAELTLLEREHTRVSSDLHDDLGPILTAAKFNMLSITAPEEDAPAKDKAVDLLDEAVERIREIARDMMPASLSSTGLESGLHNFVNSLQTPVNVKLETKLSAPVDEGRSLHVFRLVKEIIQNCLKHAGAKNLLVRITSTERVLLIICEDDGRGIETEKPKSAEMGLGMRNLRNRTELMAGKLEIYSAKGIGTQHKITIPLHR